MFGIGSNLIAIGGPVKVNNTSTTSRNLAIAGDKGTNGVFHLVWQVSGKLIKYTNISLSTGQGTITTPSDGTGYTNCYNPTVTVINGSPKVAFVGERYEDIGWDWVKEPEDDKVKKWVPPGGGGDGEWVKRAITRRIDINTGTWATMHGAVGNNVINCDISTIGSNYVYSYTYDGGKFSGDKTNVVTASTDFSGIEVSTNSKNFHLANGSNLDDLYGIDVEYSDLSYTMVDENGDPIEVSSSEPPFALRKVGVPGQNTMYKIAANNHENFGREAVLSKDGQQFYFTMGAVKVDGEQIGFVEIPETLTVKNKHHWDNYLMTEPFILTDASKFSFGVMYGVADSASQQTALSNGEHINFKLKLIDAENGSTIGEYEDIKFSKNNPIINTVYDQVVDTKGIGSRTVRLKIEINENIKPVYTIGNLAVIDSSKKKISGNGIPYQGNLLIKEYELVQNYPNPFNPSTVIRYQLPKESEVKLRIFDILGREVTTLIDQYQKEGRYEVEFNASKLASGVYIYRLEANDFVDSKKMLLVK